MIAFPETLKWCDLPFIWFIWKEVEGGNYDMQAVIIIIIIIIIIK
jgi:hypothetical protein